MTTPSNLLTFRPLEHDKLKITAVTGLTAEQVETLAAPFLLDEKVRAVATLESFAVTLDLSGVTLPVRYRVRVWIYVLGTVAALSAISYLPVPAKPLRSRLWRLAPDVTGAEAENSNTVQVNLPSPLPVARLVCEARGVFDPLAPPEPVA